MWAKAPSHWRTLKSDDDAVFGKEIVIDLSGVAPHVSWGTSPDDSVPITGNMRTHADCRAASANLKGVELRLTQVLDA